MNKRNRFLFFFILLSAILLALVIWWIIFTKQNQDHLLEHLSENIELKRQLLKQSYLKQNKIPFGIIKEGDEFIVDPLYLKSIKENLNRKRVMFLSESFVLVILIFIGLYLVYRSFHKEIQLQMQEQNFLLTITHELKTPIASIKLYLQTIQNREMLSVNKQRSFIQKSLKQLNRLNDLINNILLSSKIHLSSKNIHEINLVSELNEIVKNYNDNFDINIYCPERLTSCFSSQDFSLIVNNIIKNATQHGFNSNKFIEISLKKDKGNWILEVTDFGKGIPKDERGHVLERFYRVGSADTRENEGTGLGLYIVQKIVNEYKGKIELLSQNDKGLTVKIEIPLGRKDEG